MELNDWLDIILEYLKVLAWPVIVFILALLYRRPLIGVLERLRKATGWGATVELERIENEARVLADESSEIVSKNEQEQIPAAPAEAHQTPEPGLSTDDTVTSAQIIELFDRITNYAGSQGLQSLQTPPITLIRRFIVEEHWDRLENEAAVVRKLLGLNRNQARFIPSLFSQLVYRGLADRDTEDVALRLHTLRNKIRHADDGDYPLSPTATDDFIETTNNLTAILTRIKYTLLQEREEDPNTDSGA